MAPFIAAVIYVVISAFAFQFMDERNGVVQGMLLPNRDHWAAAKQANLYLPPGFSLYILAAITASKHLGGSYFHWRLLQDCLSTAVSAFIILKLMFLLSKSVWPGWGAILVLLYNLAYSAGTATDTPMASFLPWFFAGLFLLMEALKETENGAFRSMLSGVMLAVSSLFRADILLFLPFIGIVLLLTKPVLRAIPLGPAGVEPYITRKVLCLALLGFAVTLLPSTMYARFHSTSRVFYSSYFIDSHTDGMSRFPGNPVSEAFPALVKQLPSRSLLDIARIHLTLIQSYPVDWLKLWLEKLWRPWYASDSGRWDMILATQSVLLIGPILTGMYVWLKMKGADLGFILGVSIIAYYWVLIVMAASLNRIMPPAYPFLGMFAGFGAEAIWLSRRRKLARQLTPV